MNNSGVDKIFRETTVEEWLERQARLDAFLSKTLPQEALDDIVEQTVDRHKEPERSQDQPESQYTSTSQERPGDLAGKIKDAVSMYQVAAAYGVRLDRHGFGLCPFHREKTNSFHVLRNGRGWHCFGCGRSGDVISFVRERFDLDFRDAAEKLNDDFGLGIPLRRRLTPRQKAVADHRQEREQQLRRLREEALQRAELRCSEAWRWWTLLDVIRWKCSPQYLWEHFPKLSHELYETAVDLWAAALHELPLAEYECDEADSERYTLEHQL